MKNNKYPCNRHSLLALIAKTLFKVKLLPVELRVGGDEEAEELRRQSGCAGARRTEYSRVEDDSYLIRLAPDQQIVTIMNLDFKLLIRYTL